jgi:hypothetical protein
VIQSHFRLSASSQRAADGFTGVLADGAQGVAVPAGLSHVGADAATVLGSYGKDRRRDNASVARREATMRYDWADVHDRPCAVAAEVAEALIARGRPAASLCACAPGCAAAHLRQP